MMTIFGGILAVLGISKLIGFIFLRKFEGARKANIAVALAIPVAAVIAAYAMADGGAPQFSAGLKIYGMSGALLLAMQNIYFWFKGRKTDEAAPPS
jgi:hypothetical protein